MSNNYFKVYLPAPNQIDGVFPFDDRDDASTRRAWNDADRLRDLLDDEDGQPFMRRTIAVLHQPLRSGAWSGCPVIFP